jgi:hypothetical protein
MSSFFPIVRDRILQSCLEEGRKQEIRQILLHGKPSDAELAVLFGVMNIRASWSLLGRDDPIAEILRGAHVRVWDDGSRYEDWKQLPGVQPRPSSHPSDGTQYHVDGPLVHTALFGKIGNLTWLQLENHSVGITNIPGHALDYIKYISTRKNQGPYGSSRYIDSRPMRVFPHTYWRVFNDAPPSGDMGSIG